MSLAFDEFGRPFIILREQESKKRLKGPEAYKVYKNPIIFYIIYIIDFAELLIFLNIINFF